MEIPVPVTATVQLGDRIRFSTELLLQLHAMPDHRSEMVEVVDIRSEAFGVKTLVLRRVEPTN